MKMLAATNMTGGYGGADILHGCSLLAEPGRISVIVGPNGAGKSTAMKAIFGLVELSSGSVNLNDQDITDHSVQGRVKLGMAFVPQVRNVFPSMTVEENLEMGAFLHPEGAGKAMAAVFDLFPALADLRKSLAGNLSGGQRQQVAVGRAMMTEPSILMLDEPTAGVSPLVMDALFDMIVDVARTGVSILMCEQNASQALEIADTGFVLVQGRNRYTDTGSNLLSNPEVRRSFLGG